MYTATVALWEPHEDQDELYWVSLDGEHYLPVTRLPEPGEEAEVAALLAGNGKMKPMTWAARAIRWTAERESTEVEWGVVA